MKSGTCGYRVAVAAGILLVLAPARSPAQVPQFHITISPEDSTRLVTRDEFSNESLPAKVEYGGKTWTGASIRFKGRSTRYFPKKSYRLKFPSHEEFQGARQINLHAMYSDKSFLREKLAWDLFAAMGELAPSASFAGVSINNRPMGLFLVVDHIDKRFLARRGRPVAPLYNAGGYYSLGNMTIQPEDLLREYYTKEIGDTNDFGDLADLLNALNSAPDSLFPRVADSLMDLESVFNWLAGNILMMSGDSYEKNYYLYRDTARRSGQWTVIPWDYDLTFGLSGDPGIQYPKSLLNDGFSYMFPPLTGPANVLKDRIWKIPSLRERLHRRVDTLLRTVFTEGVLHPRIDSLAALIRDEVRRDPQKWGTERDFLDNVEALKYYVTARRNFLMKTFIAPPAGMYEIATMRINNINTPYYFQGLDGQQFATLWFRSLKGLDSVLVEVFTDSLPPAVPAADSAKFVRRWLRITAYPPEASFTATLQWTYIDASSVEREVGKKVTDERALQCLAYDGDSWDAVPTVINPFANTATVESITEKQCDGGTVFALAVP